jgi:hypothetical protein
VSAPDRQRRQEHTTCEHCGRTLVRPTGARHWQHLGADGCGDATALPVRPGAALRVLLLALLGAGVCEIVLYEDGFEIGGGAHDASLLFVRGAFTTDQVAGLLGVPIEAVNDLRCAPTPNRPGDDPRFTRHGLSLLGGAAAWRYLADPQAADLSDHFWLAVLGVEVMVRRRPDGIYVSVEDDGIDLTHGPLLVEVNNGGANQYGDDHRDEQGDDESEAAS